MPSKISPFTFCQFRAAGTERLLIEYQYTVISGRDKPFCRIENTNFFSNVLTKLKTDEFLLPFLNAFQRNFNVVSRNSIFNNGFEFMFEHTVRFCDYTCCDDIIYTYRRPFDSGTVENILDIAVIVVGSGKK